MNFSWHWTTPTPFYCIFQFGLGVEQVKLKPRTRCGWNYMKVKEPSWYQKYLDTYNNLHDILQFLKAPEGSVRKFEAQKQLANAMAHRTHIDSSIKLVGKLLFGIEKGPEVLKNIRPTGQPLVDDWDCLKSLVRFVTAFPQYYCLWIYKPKNKAWDNIIHHPSTIIFKSWE